MNASRAVFFIGLLLYISSFFLPGASASGIASDVFSGDPGYACALVTLLSPWSPGGMQLLRLSPAQYFAELFSGWINPVFLITAVLLLRRRNGLWGPRLRIITLVMFPACWILFYQWHYHPAIGYWLWTASMLVVLFSTMFVGKDRNAGASAVAA